MSLAYSLAYSVATNGFTIEQLEGQACAVCGADFQPGQQLDRVWEDSDFDLYAHAVCPEGGETQ